MTYKAIVETLSFEEIQSTSGGESLAGANQVGGILAGLSQRPNWDRERSAISALLTGSQNAEDLKALENLAGDFAGKVNVSSIMKMSNLKMNNLNSSMQRLLQTINKP